MFARIEAEERAKFADVDIEDDDGDGRGGRRGGVGGGDGVTDKLGGALAACLNVPAGDVPLQTVARRFLVLGAVAFGGPPAHVALMQVQPWRADVVDDAAFASLFALTQCLPGPSSTQLAVALGVLQGGLYGGLVAIACFSVVATTSMTLLGSLQHASSGVELGQPLGAILTAISMGLGAAAVALVAKAAMMLATKLATDPLTRGLNVLAAAAVLVAPGTSWTLPVVLGFCGLVSAAESRWRAWLPASASSRLGLMAGENATDEPTEAAADDEPPSTAAVPVSHKLSLILVSVWAGLLFVLGLWVGLGAPWWIALFEPFYRVGSLVWGGGPVVLPLLLPETVPRFVSDRTFLRAFALVQAMPGPMFNFSAYIGGAYAGPFGAIIAWLGLFTPGTLLIYAALPHWAKLRQSKPAQAFLRGVNAAASGLVLAATILLLDHIPAPPQKAIALVTFAVHHFLGPTYFGPKLNPPLTILLGAALGIPLCLPWALGHQEAEGGGVAAPSPSPPASLVA